MWAYPRPSFELQHLFRLLLWGGASVLIGSLLLIGLSFRRSRAPLVSNFATQCAIWGSAELIWGWYAGRDVPLRDYEGAASLARLLWLAIGLEAGAILVGLTLAIGGWTYVKRLGLVGSGMGIVLQASALITLDLIFELAIRL